MKLTTRRKKEIFKDVLVDFSFIGFHKELDKALAIFIEEKVGIKKTINNFTILEFCKWVNEKCKGDF